MTARQAWCATCDGVMLCDERGCIACRAANRERARALRTNGPIGLAAFCAICIDGTEGLHPVRLDTGGPRYTICRRCDTEGAAEPTRARRTKYTPLDQLLERMRVRILRALHHFDWVTTDVLVAALEIGAHWRNPERIRYDKELHRTLRAGLVERDESDPDQWLYRITPAGRASYAAALRRSAA